MASRSGPAVLAFAAHCTLPIRHRARCRTASIGIPRRPSTAKAAFGRYRLDPRGKSLFRGGELVGLSPYEFEVLHLLVLRLNVVLSKDVLIGGGWHDTAVGYNSPEKR